jgi:hypothetical protein
LVFRTPAHEIENVDDKRRQSSTHRRKLPPAQGIWMIALVVSEPMAFDTVRVTV